ncbi:MAG: mycofactocin precursor MftA [Actinobacteria bacterium]|nr:mycofactocin precursor MftA [Actinomycetota bacterium]
MIERAAPTVPETGGLHQPPVSITNPDDEAVLEEDGLIEEDLLVEDVSIDGMCGVY